jgi:four helix bundle protein
VNGYKDLKIYNLAFELAIKIHYMSLTLPKYELYEQGSQIRRSSKSIKDTIAEGYGRKRYKNDFIRFLIYAQASCDECVSQLETIKKLYNPDDIDALLIEYDSLGKMIYQFIQWVENNWKPIKVNT